MTKRYINEVRSFELPTKELIYVDISYSTQRSPLAVRLWKRTKGKTGKARAKTTKWLLFE